ncbi:hypothetical protein DNTS_008593, partial [Danionella cerebrum]
RSAPDANATPGAPGAPEGEGGAPAAPPNLTSNRRLQQTQAQVDEVVDIMRVNVDKVLERDQKLSELDDRADALQAGASQFESSAAKLKNKYWWKNMKCTSTTERLMGHKDRRRLLCVNCTPPFPTNASHSVHNLCECVRVQSLMQCLSRLLSHVSLYEA